MTYKNRKRLALFILVVGMPAYVVFAVTVMSNIDRLPKWLELPTYIFLGIAWAIPFRWVFLGIGKDDPDAPQQDQD
ncbi:DUF2842 domain-containing protein [Nioella sp.]|jgi:hypothetical protein|uniref:DUF2842 domain-containing protein n=1 Tax=Nioella sp. TaxID=1912091 RepID=UPI0035194086